MDERLREDAKAERRTRGATAVEYALMAALIAAVIISIVGALGTRTEGMYDKTNTEMTNAGL